MKQFLASLALLAMLPVMQIDPAFATTETPEQFVERTSNEVLSILRDPALGHAAKISKLEKMMDERSDFETISRLVLAVHYRQFSDTQKTEFVTLLHRYLTTTYGQQIDNYGNEEVSVTGGREEARGDYTVQPRLTRKQGAPMNVEYRLRKSGDKWLLIDVIGEGISLVSNLRSQFGEILNAGGPEQLLKVLREKNASGTPANLPKAQES